MTKVLYNLKYNPAMFNNIPEIMEYSNKILEEHKIPSDLNLQFQLAIEEVLTNILDHGYNNEGGYIAIKATYEDSDQNNGMIKIYISDHSEAFNPNNMKVQNIHASIKERKIGGLGIYIVSQIMDNVSYSTDDGENTLELSKTVNQFCDA